MMPPANKRFNCTFALCFFMATLLIVCSSVVSPSQLQSPDPGIRDTCRLMPVDSIWVLTPHDTLFAIEAWHFTDDSLGGFQHGFAIRTSCEDWTPALDSNIVIDTVIVTPDMGNLRGTMIARLPDDTINAFQYGALAFSGSLLPVGEPYKVADISLAVKNQQNLPGKFIVHFDSSLLNSASAFKHTPANPDMGSGYPPIYGSSPCSVTVVKLSEICGNADGIGTIDMDDIVFLIAYIYNQGPSPELFQAGDINCDGKIDLLDVVGLVNFVFKGGAAPCSDCL